MVFAMDAEDGKIDGRADGDALGALWASEEETAYWPLLTLIVTRIRQSRFILGSILSG